MKSTISLRTGLLGMGLLAGALMPALAQAPAAAPGGGPTGKLHGHVTNPTGASQGGGSVSLIGAGATPAKAPSFPVDDKGDFTGEVPAGTYKLVYRTPGMAADKEADHVEVVKIVAGQDTAQDVDMSRAEYINALPAEQKKQLEDLKKHNSEALKSNEVIKGLNADLKTVTQDIKDADTAQATAVSQLGASAAKGDVDAKAQEIRTAKYTEVETLMTKDTAAKADAAVLWAELGQAQAGLKEYDKAEVSYKKALEVNAAAKKQDVDVEGLSQSGLGEIYARTSKAQQASDAYDAAAKANPTKAAFYLKNEAVIFFQSNQPDAQVAAADKAIAADPSQPILYYLKGNGLVQKTTMDDKTHKLVPPAGCMEAYQKYLQLAPDGPYSAEVKGILAGFDQKIDTTYKAPKKK